MTTTPRLLRLGTLPIAAVVATVLVATDARADVTVDVSGNGYVTAECRGRTMALATCNPGRCSLTAMSSCTSVFLTAQPNPGGQLGAWSGGACALAQQNGRPYCTIKNGDAVGYTFTGNAAPAAPAAPPAAPPAPPAPALQMPTEVPKGGVVSGPISALARGHLHYLEAKKAGFPIEYLVRVSLDGTEETRMMRLLDKSGRVLLTDEGRALPVSRQTLDHFDAYPFRAGFDLYAAVCGPKDPAMTRPSVTFSRLQGGIGGFTVTGRQTTKMLFTSVIATETEARTALKTALGCEKATF